MPDDTVAVDTNNLPDNDDEGKVYIFRAANRKKAMDLRGDRDYRTGFSFFDFPPAGDEFVVYEVQQLREAGFTVLFDGEGGQDEDYARDFVSGGSYIEPNSGQPVIYDIGHVTVVHSDIEYWTVRHEADKANVGSETSSPQLDSWWSLKVDGPTKDTLKWQ